MSWKSTHVISGTGPSPACESLPTTAVQWESSFLGPTAQSVHQCREEYRPAHLRDLLPMIAPRSVVVEAGCGLGQYVYMFASLGHHCIGVDYSSKLISEAKRHGENMDHLAGTTRWVHGNLLDLPIESGSVDCYSSFGVLEHFTVRQQRRILSEAWRVLRPGGLLYQYVPNFWSPWTIRREIRYWFRKYFPPELVWQRNMSRRKLQSLAGSSGFQRVSCKSVYATIALRKMSLPPVLLRYTPKTARDFSLYLTERVGDWCDAKNVLGYGIVYIGRKEA